MYTMANDTEVRRRRYGPELKARVVAECEARTAMPGDRSAVYMCWLAAYLSAALTSV